MDPPEDPGELGPGAQESEAPAADGMALGEGADDHAPVPERRHVGHREVRPVVEDEVRVHLVGDHSHVPPLAQGGDQLEVLRLEGLARGVGRGVEEDRPGGGAKGGGKFVGVDPPAEAGVFLGLPQSDEPGPCTRQFERADEVFVVGVEDDDLVIRVDQGEERHAQRLGAADRDGQLGVRVGRRRERLRDPASHVRTALREFVLVGAASQRPYGFLDERPRGPWHAGGAHGQIDRTALAREHEQFGEIALGESPGPSGDRRMASADRSGPRGHEARRSLAASSDE